MHDDVRPDRLLTLAVMPLMLLLMVPAVLSSARFAGLPLSAGQLWALSAGAVAAAAVMVIRPLAAAAAGAVTVAAAAFGWWRWPEPSQQACESVVAGLGEIGEAVGAWVNMQPWTMSPLSAAILCGGLCLLAAVVLFVIALRRRDMWPVLLVGNVLLAWQWMLWLDQAFWLAVWFNLVGLTMIGVSQLLWRNQMWRARPPRFRHMSLVSRLPSFALLALACTVVAIILPFGFRPMDWPGLGDWMNSRLPFATLMRGQQVGDRPYEYAFGAPGRESPLGGPGPRHGEDILYIDLDGDLPWGPLYLRGTVRDRYTGTSWVQTSTRSQEYRREDRLEYEPLAVSRGLIRQEVAVLRGQTNLVFCAPEILTANVPGSRYFVDDAGSVRARTALVAGSRYQAVSAFPMLDIGTLWDVAPVLPSSDPALSRYLQLPDGLPERVYQLANEIKSSAPSRHVVDVIVTIERHLRGIPYSLSPPDLPAGADFVDHFLFESRRGYCTYHSTAMVVLLRCLGIPARWAEGFIIQQPTASAANVVRGTDAHAWAEVYIEGLGWLPFEPTPAYGPGYRRQLDYRRPSAHVRTPWTHGDELWDDGWFEDLPPFTGVGGDQGVLPTPSDSPGPGMGLGAGLLGVLLALWGGAWLRLRRRERLPTDPGRAVAHSLELCLDLFRRFGHPRPQSVTPLEFADVVAAEMPDDEEDYRQLCDSYYRVVYGGKTATEGERQHAAGIWRMLASRIRQRWGWPQFFLRRIL